MTKKLYPALATATVLALLAVLAPAPGSAAEQRAPAAEQNTPAAEEGAQAAFIRDFQADLTRVGQRLVDLAEAVPADKYAWRPAPDVRTVGEVYMHVVGANTFIPTGLGAAPPAGLEIGDDPRAQMVAWERDVTAKADVVSRLRESFAYAGEAVATITDHDAQADFFGFPASKRAYLLILLTHAHEHLGQSIAYARSIGVTPPWSQQESTGEEGSAAAD